jgi:hypothetical protein
MQFLSGFGNPCMASATAVLLDQSLCDICALLCNAVANLALSQLSEQLQVVIRVSLSLWAGFRGRQSTI